MYGIGAVYLDYAEKIFQRLNLCRFIVTIEWTRVLDVQEVRYVKDRIGACLYGRR